MTAEAIINAGASLGNIEYQDCLYNASSSDILYMIQRAQEKAVLVIAHNPGIHQLARLLVGNGHKSDIEKLNIFYNPATLSVFDCPCERWEEIEPGKNRLVNLISPSLKSHEAKE